MMPLRREADALRDELARGASTRDAAATVAQRTGRRKREVYELARTVRHTIVEHGAGEVR